MQDLISNRILFNRNSYLIINGVTIWDHNNHGLKFDVEIKSGEKNKVGIGKISIYNLVQKIEINSEIELFFGYADDVGYYGIYEVIKSDKKRNGGDLITELSCTERSRKSSKIVSLSLDGNIRISEAIKEVCNNSELNLISMELTNDKLYTNGYTCYNQAYKELKELAEDSESKILIKGQDVYFYTDKVQEKVIHLNFSSGLLKNPYSTEKQSIEHQMNNKFDNKKEQPLSKKNKKQSIKKSNKYDYTVECLPIHYIKKGDSIYVTSEIYTGYLQIEEIQLNLKSEWQMILETKVIKNE